MVKVVNEKGTSTLLQHSIQDFIPLEVNEFTS